MRFKNTLLPVSGSLQSRGRLLDVSKPVVMGILNATPDSFHTRGRNSTPDALLATAERMLQDGATILDVGGATTRPGSEDIGADAELERVMPAIEAIVKRFPEAWLSIDTFHSTVAKETVEAGVSMVNDISGGRFDAEMLATVACLKVPYIAMHIQGTPKTMQKNPRYEDVVNEVFDALNATGAACTEAGITDLILDVGFGFGKSLEHNYALLRNMHVFRAMGRPILAGISRKGMIQKVLNCTSDEALNGTTALHMVALQQGANILRVHDVKEAIEAIKLWNWTEG